jgi:hypothetical protein
MTTTSPSPSSGSRTSSVPSGRPPAGQPEEREVALVPPSPSHVAEQRSSAWWLLALVPMVLCCAGPLILGALATLSAATLGAAGGVLGAVLLAVAVLWWVRRQHRAGQPAGRGGACCSPTADGWQR